MMKIYEDFEKLITYNVPKDSTITSTGTKQVNGSTFLVVHYTIATEHQAEYDLTYNQRILQIRIIKGEQDQGLPIISFADIE